MDALMVIFCAISHHTCLQWAHFVANLPKFYSACC